MKVKFVIDHLDPLGQGVAKNLTPITFIPKTLPGETGIAEVTKSSAKVQFASLTSLEQASSLRITPDCPHFDQCNGCHYLHCSYEDEVSFKEKSFAHWLSRSWGPENSHSVVLKSNQREYYRNRIQLHYNKKTKTLGFKNKNKILEVPNCRLPMQSISEKVKELYQNKSWLKLVKNEPMKGHIEVYQKSENEAVVVTLNRPYSDGGFTQVHPKLNEKFVSTLTEILSKTNNGPILDLFGGSGNMTRKLSKFPSYVIDIYENREVITSDHQQFISQNLYEDNAINACAEKIHGKIDTLVLDPPRSGFKQLELWCERFKPERIVYISCNYQTMLRDVVNIQENYTLSEHQIIDFFPGTKHFETCLIFNKKF